MIADLAIRCHAWSVGARMSVVMRLERRSMDESARANSCRFPIRCFFPHSAVGIRVWNGTNWVLPPVPPTSPLSGSNISTVIIFNTSGAQAFAPYLESFPILDLPPIPLDTSTIRNPSNIALILAIALPPIVMLSIVLLGLRCNGLRHPNYVSESEGSSSPDKGM